MYFVIALKMLIFEGVCLLGFLHRPYGPYHSLYELFNLLSHPSNVRVLLGQLLINLALLSYSILQWQVERLRELGQKAYGELRNSAREDAG